jgi:predicted nucleotidyltransferase component of viral defense system
MRKPVANIGASVRQRLINLSRETGQGFELLLTRYAIERLLYRLSVSPNRERFVLKGAMLVTTWFNNPHRPTRDVDFLGFGDPDPAKLVAAFQEVCGMAFDDGVTFDAGGITVDRIREENDYGGVRLRTTAVIDGARVRVVIDIAFGDATEPGLVDLELPVLLDQPPPRLRAYAQETVIAEKFQAMVALGRANSRMKDLYDVWMLSKSYRFEDDRLARAIAATFARRETAIPTELPDALSPAFADDPAKQEQWAAFVRELGHDPGPLPLIVSDLAKFLMPHAIAATSPAAKR